MSHEGWDYLDKTFGNELHHITGHVVDAYGDHMATVKVPVKRDSLTPDVPRVIECNGWFAYLHNTNPLTYKRIETPTTVEKV